MRGFKFWLIIQIWSSVLSPATASKQAQPVQDAPHLAPNPDNSQFTSSSSDPSPLQTPHGANAAPATVVSEPMEDQDQDTSTLTDVPSASWELTAIPPPPNLASWVGVAGGAIGVMQFIQDKVNTIISLIREAAKETPKHIGPPSWVVAVQVGADGLGLEGAAGDFPQVCLWNFQGQLLGWNDQTMDFKGTDLRKVPGEKGWNLWRLSRPEGMPRIPSGGMKAVGVWPPPDRMHLKAQQATYVTLIKRHFDAICVASVHVEWPDRTTWAFDGTWGRASNVSWYLSHVYDSDARQRECFWLDQAGFLDPNQGRKEYLVNDIGDRLHRWAGFEVVKKKNLPKWFWKAAVVPAQGLPDDEDLTDGMIDNGVDEGRTPLGVKFFLPAFRANSYADGALDKMGVDAFAGNPGKIEFFYDNMKQGDHPVFPIMHPHADLADPTPYIMDMPDDWNDNVPPDCLTDWYYNRKGRLVSPLEGDRCTFKHSPGLPRHQCRPKENWKREAVEAPVSVRQRFARTLVVDTTSKGGSATANLCKDPHSAGPSYANHVERQFCRMTDKTLWPFCDEAEGPVHDCFDDKAEVLVEEKAGVAKRDVHWDQIQDWSHGGKVYGRSLGITGEPYLHR